ncbi:MAG: cytochrome ubiquinol oxidase subunit I [Eggerthellaceae bacterium]|nr:cytochrome ubiquinol oxidase subunit I [Eggerthellaceae bacterium]
MDVELLARFQFAFTAFYHYLFVPVNVGLGLIVALMQMRYSKTRKPEDLAIVKWWTKFFTVTFAMGVATGITMEFSFGTNWANYSRFVGDIFGAPLAAEALLAFFMESTFLGVLLLGRGKVSEKFMTAAAWLVFLGSAFSCLWILIANSWMQTPGGYAVEGGKAILTDFFGAAFNPSTVARFTHTVDALILMGSFIAIAIGAYHLVKGEHKYFGQRQIQVGAVVALVACILMLPFAHMQASVVANEQPEKLAAMEGQYEDGPAHLYLFGVVDEANQTVNGIKLLDGGTSLLAWGDASRETIGLNTAKENFEQRIAEIRGDSNYLQNGERFVQQVGSTEELAVDATAPVQITFQSYHLMIALYSFIVLWVIFALVVRSKINKGGALPQGLLKALYIAPIFPLLAIEAGWFVAEFGRQPWSVWEELLVADAISPAVDSIQLIITMLLFAVVYLLLLFLFLKNAFRIAKEGPEPVAITEGEVA